jgi:hypothetical protein
MLFYHVLASMLLLLLLEKMKYLVWCLRWDFLSSKIMSHILAPPSNADWRKISPS